MISLKQYSYKKGGGQKMIFSFLLVTDIFNKAALIRKTAAPFA